MSYFSVVGLDLSLTGAGVATILDNGGVAPILRVHTFGRRGSKTETLSQRLGRIGTLTNEVREVVRTLDVHPSLAAVESPAQSQTTGSTHDRSGSWWDVVRTLSYDMGIPVIEIGISKVKIYATGKGTAAKDEVMAAAIRRYLDVPIANNNESDAFMLAAMAARLIGEPIDELPKTHVRAMEGLVLP